jgi:predicted membrane-bound mannosyltransferase
MLMLTLMYLAIVSGIAWIVGSVVFHVAWAGMHLLLPVAIVCGVASLVMRIGRRRTA